MSEPNLNSATLAQLELQYQKALSEFITVYLDDESELIGGGL